MKDFSAFIRCVFFSLKILKINGGKGNLFPYEMVLHLNVLGPLTIDRSTGHFDYQLRSQDFLVKNSIHLRSISAKYILLEILLLPHT